MSSLGTSLSPFIVCITSLDQRKLSKSIIAISLFHSHKISGNKRIMATMSNLL
jgi:hypothetical protein